MSEQVRLVLGDIEFTGFEVPEEVPFGGVQNTKTHVLQGGKKVVDAMGATEDAVGWSGRFRGANAVQRANAVDALRKAGRPVRLTWHEFALTVLVVEFHGRFGSPREVPYSIVCEVISDDARPAVPGLSVGPTQMVTSDFRSAFGALQGPGLGGALGGLQAAVKSVRNFATASRDQLASVLRPVLAARSAVDEVFQAAEDAVGSVQAIGGVIPGLYGRDLTGGLLAQVAAARDGAAAFEADAYLGRMATNLEAVGTNGAVVTVAGGDLFKLAAATYGDAAEWATIARANGITDPLLVGVQDLTVPPNPANTGGVLNG